ncbi:cytochrome P450 734A1-like isoform X2 [Tasmannia lanceolata]|uniref:cytochrome P450 734A1-like isoform X2 n=1 Tax=Tasmannia lanceolata TaxID=3420 RepID=UPI004064C222
MALPLHLFATFSVFLLLVSLLLRTIRSFVWVPWKLELHFQKQGLSGPPRTFFFGNTGEIQELSITGKVDDYRSKLYGMTFVCWFGSKPRLAVVDPELIKEVLLNRSGVIERVPFDPIVKQLFGDGMPSVYGEKWVRHRKIGNTAFNMERVKEWVPAITESTRNMLDKWEREGGEKSEFEIEVYGDLLDFTADVISKTAFGSSFQEGKRIFKLQDEQAVLVSHAQKRVYIPGYRFVPTKENMRLWRLDKEIRQSLQKLIENYGEVGMIIDESLRLYPPAPSLLREVHKDIMLGKLHVPSGTQLYIPLIAVHHNAEIWGEDAEKFNPLRSRETARHLATFFPFGIGPRICLGQNLALVEAKIALAMILQRFTFAVSPTYVHAPTCVLTVQPGHGAHLIFQKI